MLFNSPDFLFVFLPVALLGFQLAGMWSRTAAIAWLGLISLVFYGAWKVEFIPLLAGSIAFNYAAAVLIARSRDQERRQNLFLALGIAANLAALFYFKYQFPLLAYLRSEGWIHHGFQAVILPLGISFFTFTQIAYLVDLKQETAALEPPANYLLFVTFFPHLIAGPILHHAEMMPQLKSSGRLRLEAGNLAAGVSLFVIGLCKKVVIADRIAVYAAPVFADTGQASFFGAWGGVLCYAMQLYFDFSGYSDMAIGLAYMFSIRFPLNFNSPYKARSIIDFWQRWHMTLTRYLTLYIYNPLAVWVRRRQVGGAKKSRNHAGALSLFAQSIFFPMIATMFLAGIWHGAGLQFIIFGLLHGFYLSINHAWRMFGAPVRLLFAPVTSRVPGLMAGLSTLLVFLAVLIGQVFFRANSTADALRLLAGMAGQHGVGAKLPDAAWAQVLFLTVCFGIVWYLPNSQEILSESGMFAGTSRPSSSSHIPSIGRWKPNLVWAAVLSFLFLFVLMNMKRISQFLYFQF